MEYNAVKAALHHQNVSFKLLFPARLIVKIGMKTYSYDTVTKARGELLRLMPTIRF